MERADVQGLMLFAYKQHPRSRFYLLRFAGGQPREWLSRVLTDVTGEPFWTIVAEVQVERVDDFFTVEQTLMTNDRIRAAMADYHDLVDNGRREIYRLEN